MTNAKIKKLPPINKAIFAPPDKSISHRSVMVSSIAEGNTLIRNFLKAEDCLQTMGAFKKMGVSITEAGENDILVKGRGLRGLSRPDSEIYLGNSGTSMRLILGILAGHDFEVTLAGDESLSGRPMKRVTQPLKAMGAHIEGSDDANFAPIKIKGAKLKPINYNLPIPSAQVKSCLMFASLYADGTSNITEPQKSRDHTERMFKLFKAKVSADGKISVTGNSPLISPRQINIPADISSAAFFIALALLLPKSEITIKSCGINPTRMGLVETLKKMGAEIEIINIKGKAYEPEADIVVKSSNLKSITIEPEKIPGMIDEIPILSLVAAFARGQTIIKGVGELRVKETDRINSIVTNLKNMGVDIIAKEDMIMLKGPNKLNGARVKSFGDHRTAMTMAIAGALADGETIVEDTDCINTSFPGFLDIISQLQA